MMNVRLVYKATVGICLARSSLSACNRAVTIILEELDVHFACCVDTEGPGSTQGLFLSARPEPRVLSCPQG